MWVGATVAGVGQRQNSTYVSVNLRNDQLERLDKLASSAGENRNSLIRLIAETMKLADVQTLQKRR